MKAKAFELTAAARLDLLQISNYYAEHGGPALARKISSEFRAGMLRLSSSPGLGNVREEFTGRPLLFYRVNSYFIIYDPERVPVRIMRVLHAARDLRSILNPE